jgi:hypothetical protein
LTHFANPLGEFTLLVPPMASPDAVSDSPDASALAVELGELTNNGRLKRREALKVLAERHGMSVNDLYRRLGSIGS